MKNKYKVIIMASIVASALTFVTFAADPVTAIKSAEAQIRDGVSALCGLSGVIGAIIMFATTRRFLRTVGVLAAGAVLSLLVADSNTLKSLMEGAVAWFKV